MSTSDQSHVALESASWALAHAVSDSKELAVRLKGHPCESLALGLAIRVQEAATSLEVETAQRRASDLMACDRVNVFAGEIPCGACEKCKARRHG